MTKFDIEQRAREILSRLGKMEEKHFHEDSDDYAIWYSCSYDGYGFMISLGYGTNYVLSYEVLKRTLPADGYLSVSYDFYTVYNSNGVFIHGEWERLLDLLYTKIPALEMEKIMLDELCTTLDISYMPKGIDVFLKDKNMTWYMKECYEGDVDTYDFRRYRKHKIRKNGRLVLDIDYYGYNYNSITKEEYHEYKLLCFERGEWINELRHCLDAAYNAQEKKKTEESSRRLRDFYETLLKK